MPITFLQWKEINQNGQGFTPQEREIVRNVQSRLQQIAITNRYEKLDEFSTNIAITTLDPEELNDEQESREKITNQLMQLNELNDYLLSGNNLSNILKADRNTGNNTFGDDGAVLFQFMNIMQDKLKIKYDEIEMSNKYTEASTSNAPVSEEDLINVDLFGNDEEELEQPNIQNRQEEVQQQFQQQEPPQENQIRQQVPPPQEQQIPPQNNNNNNNDEMEDEEEDIITGPDNLDPFSTNNLSAQEISARRDQFLREHPGREQEINRLRERRERENPDEIYIPEVEDAPEEMVINEEYTQFKNVVNDGLIKNEDLDFLKGFAAKSAQAATMLSVSAPSQRMAEQVRDVMLSTADVFDFEFHDTRPSQPGWFKSRESVRKFKDILSRGDNFKNLMIELTDGENPPFGKDGEDFFRWAQLMNDNLNAGIDVEALRNQYNTMKPEILQVQADCVTQQQQVEAARSVMEQRRKEYQENKDPEKTKELHDKLDQAHAQYNQIKHTYRRRNDPVDFESLSSSIIDLSDDKNQRMRRLVGKFGPNAVISDNSASTGKGFSKEVIEQVEGLKIPATKDLPDWLIATANFGAASDDTVFDFAEYYPQSHLNKEEQRQFGRQFIWMNILINDGRTSDYNEVMLEARKRTADAVDAYNNGNIKPLKECIQAFVTAYKKDNIKTENDPKHTYMPNRQFHSIIKNLMDNYPQFGVKEMFTKEEMELFKASYAQMKAADRQRDTAAKLVNDFPPRGSKEREDLAFKMIFDQCVSVADEYSGSKDPAETTQPMLDAQLLKYKTFLGADTAEKINSIFVKNAVDPKTPADEKARLSAISLTGKSELDEMFKRDVMTPAQAMLAEPAGERKLANIYKNAIKHSEKYQAIIDARSKEELAQAVSKVAALGDAYMRFGDIKGASLDNTEQINKVINSDKFKQKLAEREANIATQALSQSTAVFECFESKINTAPELYRKAHKDSKEIKKLREAHTALSQMMSQAKESGKNGLDVFQSADFKDKLLEAYESAVEYKEAKRINAKQGPDWKGPTSTMGSARYEGANKIIELAKEFIPDVIKSKEASKEAADIHLKAQVDKFKDFDNATKGVKPAKEEMPDPFHPAPKLSKEENLDYMKELVANVIAANEIKKTVRIGLSSQNAYKPSGMIAQDIKERTKALLKDDNFNSIFGKNGLSLSKISKLTTEKNGAGIMNEFYNRTAAAAKKTKAAAPAHRNSVNKNLNTGKGIKK